MMGLGVVGGAILGFGMAMTITRVGTGEPWFFLFGLAAICVGVAAFNQERWR